MNERLQQQLDALIKTIEARTQSEKIIVMVTLIAGMALTYLSVSFDPLSADLTRIEAQVANVERQIQSQQATYAGMVAASQEDPTRFANERLRVINRELQQLDGEITNLAGDLITPNEMTRILTSVLTRYSGLELIRFQNKAATPLRTGVANSPQSFDTDNDELFEQVDSSNVDGQVYEHGLTLQFQGDFFTTLKYLRFLEEVTGSFFWDSISFRQTEWPRAAITLEIHTLSTDEGFIGV